MLPTDSIHGWIRVARALVLGCALTACAMNPVSRQPELVLVSEEREIELGREAARELEDRFGLVPDPELASYVDRIGRRLASHAPRAELAWTFRVIDRPEPNAFAAPGGWIYVSRGLVALTNSEDELAGVIAHEIVHVAARHYVQSRSRATGAGLLALPGVLVGETLGGTLGRTFSAPFEALGAGIMAGHSREQEREADRVGQEIMARAGYDPEALAHVLATLEDEALQRQGTDRLPSFFDTHPATEERVVSATSRAVSLPRSRGTRTADPADHLARLDGLLVGPNPADGVFDGPRFLHPRGDFTLRFPDGWRSVNNRDVAGAVSPRRDARVVVQVQSEGADPAAAAEAFLDAAASRVDLEVDRSEAASIGGLPAWRAQAVASAKGRSLRLDFSWIAHQGRIYRVTGDVPGRGEVPASLRDTARSFRPLRDAERASLTENRLRVAIAEPGESLDELCRRSANVWGASETALYNALERGTRFTGGERVKVVLVEPFRAVAAALPSPDAARQDSAAVPGPDRGRSPRRGGG